jgi:HK97 family phage portal protein
MAQQSRKRARSRPLVEQRNVEDPRIPVSSAQMWEYFGGLLGLKSAAGINVSLENAMGVPAIWAAVHFLSGTIAGLPLHAYKKTRKGPERVKGLLSAILHDAWNDETSSFNGRKYSMERVLTGGRSFTFIERNGAGQVINLWPLIPKQMTVKLKAGRKQYHYKENGETKTYEANEIIDIQFSLNADQVSSTSPIMAHKDVIGLGIAATTYGSTLFNNGGVPPFVMTGNFQSGAGMKRASDDLDKAVRDASKEKRLALSLPTGHDIKPLGIDPQKSQLVELKKFLIEEYARIYSLPPVFLQDLSHGTFSNTEQQDLHLVKHTIARWVVQIEQEMNLKLFGRGSNLYVKFVLDGLLRGDFRARMEGYAKAIQNSILMPNEARALEDRAEDPAGNVLLIQGATVPLGSQPKKSAPANGAENDEA